MARSAGPQILYLFTDTHVDRIRGDLRILEILQQKDEQANLNLGDPASFLNVYDPDKEARESQRIHGQGMTPEQVSTTSMQQQANTQSQRGRLAAAVVRRRGGGSADRQSPRPQSSDHIEAGQASSRANISLPRPP